MTRINDLPQDKIAALLAVMWQRNQPQILERLDLLDRAAAAAQIGNLTPALREEAVSTAHKLSGTLGTFGFPQATDIARELEQQLEDHTRDPAGLVTLATELRTSLKLRS